MAVDAARSARPWWPAVAGTVAIVALLAAVAWPLRGAFLHEDDFALLALARLLDDPLPAFVREHMLTMPYYRPLGLVAWWLSARAFGAALLPQYVLALGLHALVCMALAGLLRELGTRRFTAWALAAVFAVHPVAIGTTSWLSDRYDLLATLFGLLALRAMLRHAHAPTMWRLSAALMALAAALFSKETGVVLALLVGGLAWCECADRRQRRIAVAAVASLLLVYFLARLFALGFAGGGRYTGSASFGRVVQGFVNWWAELPWHLFYAPWLPRAGWLLWLLAAVCGGWQLFSGRHARVQYQWRTPLLLGLAMVLLAALVQAPFIGIQPIRAPDPADVPASVTQARFYYLGLVGLVLVASALLRSSPVRMSDWRMPVAGTAFVVVLLASALASRALVRDWRDNTRAFAPLADAAVQAIEQAALPATGCQIYLLEAGNAVLDAAADSVVKSRVADTSRVASCLVQTERTPWFQIVSADDAVGVDIAPLEPVREGGVQVPWPRIGNIFIAYTNLSARAQPHEARQALFLAFDGMAFRDVSRDVRDGRREVAFRCARSPLQCR